ncbi:MAG: formylglycine-generating enzyme family protein [Candidatus Hydrogenedentes bacterium]|nr:formylglycine-generating enzyme family protein [Candidatus Hydrogenedentota bacterium]
MRRAHAFLSAFAVTLMPCVFAVASPLADPITNSVGMKLQPVPPGSFIMGSPEHEKDRKPTETERRITISREFYIGVYEVTQAEYEAVMGHNPAREKGATLPVDHVTWHDAVAFCDKLTAQESGMRYRLPTEAEWEYTCRAGTATRYYWGDDPELASIGDHAFYKANSGGKTHIVGQKKPNPWGLHDMNGNVWEWCQDWMGPYVPEETKDPQGPAAGEGKVCRGGCWAYEASRCRSAERNDAPADSAHVNLGFRVVAEARR